jgi:hypothetical protein
VNFVGGLVCRYGEKGGKEKHRSFCHMLFHVHAKRVKMGVEKLQQRLLIGLFKTITREEREEVLQRKLKNYAMKVVIKTILYYQRVRETPC